MNQTQSVNIITKHFKSNFNEISKDIIRCRKLYKNNLYQIMYFDLSDNWTKSKDDSLNLDNYIEDILKKDYYMNSGDLQWNFYYTFISSNEKINKNLDLKWEVENDDTYARKYVVSAKQLEEWLIRSENTGIIAKTSLEKDLANQWIKMLQKSKLDFIYLDKPFNESVEEFISGKSIGKKTLNIKKQTTNNENIITHISSIKLNNYREFPIQKDYKFGKVNLIVGKNATGKTSLLEAIELLLCGKTKRNSNRKESNVRITALVNLDNDKIQYTSLNKTLRNRDTLWYNVVTPRNAPSKLYERFNRFNFFNSEATYQMSYGTQEEIRKSLEDIILGEQVNWLDDRINKFKTRFQQSLNKYENILSETTKYLSEQKILLKKLNKVDNRPEIVFNELLNLLKKYRWTRTSIKYDYDVDLVLDLNHARRIIDNINIKIDWIVDINREKIEKELKSLNEASIFIKQNNNKLFRLGNKIIKEKNKSREARDILNILSNAEKYIVDNKSKNIKGLSDKISNKKFRILTIKNIQVALKQFDLKLVPSEKQNLGSFEKNLLKSLKVLEKKKTALIDKISSFEGVISHNQQLFSEIKTLALTYIENNKEATECPLCHTIHLKGDLINLINKSNRIGTIDLDKLKIENLQIDNEIALNNKKLSNIVNLKNAIEYLDNSAQFIDEPIDSVIEKLKKKIKSFNALNNQLKQLHSLEVYFKEKDFKEEEYINLMYELQNKKVRLNRTYKDLRKDYSQKLKTYDKITSDLIKEQKFIDDNIQNKYHEVGITTEKESLIIDKIKKVKGSIISIKELEKFMTFSSKTRLSGVLTKVETITSVYSKYKNMNIKQKETEINKAETDKIINTLKEKIKNISPKRNKSKEAYNYIDNFQKKYNKSNFIDDFISNNNTAIANTFRAIHSPNEFDEILFEEDKIILKKTRSNTQSELSEISSGQKAALALSVFQVLNQQLKNGPNMMLFDDPISNIDELNVLSFLDYLRALAINTNRQIFFATADDKLAFLFEKKFGFLSDEEFKVIELNR